MTKDGEMDRLSITESDPTHNVGKTERPLSWKKSNAVTARADVAAI
jgi:hypothetical protein